MNKGSFVEGILGGAGGGGAPSFPLLAPNGALNAPSYSFSGNSGDGMYVRSSGITLNFAVAGNYVGEFQISGTGGVGNAGLILPSGGNFGWSSNTSINAADTWLWRGAPNVVFTNWLQNVGGEEALNANYTNGTAAFTNTNLSITVISGRTYNFELNLFISQTVAADGWAIDFNGGTAAMTNFIANAASFSETGAIVALANAISAALATVINATTTGTTGGQWIKVHGSFVPSGNGTFIVRARLNTLSTGVITIKRGSNLIARDSRAV